jgi:hypothetical protein
MPVSPAVVERLQARSRYAATSMLSPPSVAALVAAAATPPATTVATNTVHSFYGQAALGSDTDSSSNGGDGIGATDACTGEAHRRFDMPPTNNNTNTSLSFLLSSPSPEPSPLARRTEPVGSRSPSTSTRVHPHPPQAAAADRGDTITSVSVLDELALLSSGRSSPSAASAPVITPTAAADRVLVVKSPLPQQELPIDTRRGLHHKMPELVLCISVSDCVSQPTREKYSLLFHMPNKP